MLHPHTELKLVDAEVGYGVFATQRIPMGTITWAVDPLDQILDPMRTVHFEAKFAGSIEHYSWTNGNGRRILCWDFGRYVNHSCEANSYGPGGAEYEIAIRDIAKGDEITSDYRTLNLEAPMACSCGAPSCRGLASDDLLDAVAANCDLMIQNAFPSIHLVEQPLWQWIADKPLVTAMARDPRRVPSVLKHRWPAAKPSYAAVLRSH
jgi:hypothetical protein